MLLMNLGISHLSSQLNLPLTSPLTGLARWKGLPCGQRLDLSHRFNLLWNDLRCMRGVLGVTLMLGLPSMPHGSRSPPPPPPPATSQTLYSTTSSSGSVSCTCHRPLAYQTLHAGVDIRLHGEHHLEQPLASIGVHVSTTASHSDHTSGCSDARRVVHAQWLQRQQVHT